ncbi:hypothetical protein QUA83_10395 [Microcoleus sp. K1-B1]|uniref:hypothetical protein n=1 Tax=Microcoleus sp. K1-B6 TaxID=2818787 RepID=UPI002FD827CE
MTVDCEVEFTIPMLTDLILAANTQQLIKKAPQQKAVGAFFFKPQNQTEIAAVANLFYLDG